MIRFGILTVSDKGSKREREDLSGKLISEVLKNYFECELVEYKVVPDEFEEIEKSLIKMSDELNIDLILTTGGTGFSARDVTPEATKEVIEKEAIGIAEYMRHEGMRRTKRAMLSRGISGIRKKTLIINLPGSSKAVKESLEAILPELEHGILILKGETGECG